MSSSEKRVAFGAPGMEPRWTRSAKEGIGTAYHSSCRVWFTLSHGVINEIYYPNVDCPNTRDLQFLITDGETFFHEERRDLDHELEYPEKNVLLYRLTNSEPTGRYRIVKELLADPHSSVVLMSCRVECDDPDSRSKLRVYALLAPHMKRLGWDNSAYSYDVDARPFLRAHRDGVFLAFGATPDFRKRSVGFVGASDGWQDLQNFQMDWEFEQAEHGNVAMTAEMDLSRNGEFVLAVAFGRSAQSASTKMAQSLAVPFEQHRQIYIRQWQRALPPTAQDLNQPTGDEGKLSRLSRLVLLAHEDKVYPGALVASMSIPWGEEKGDADLGGYHLVWTRDMVKSASALLATGQISTPLRSLIWLACMQGIDGEIPQNSWVNGDAYWHGKQLDEVAAPILLAWRLRQAGGLGLFDPSTLIWRAARYLILNGPVTGQERWEENAGYSPSTLAAVIAALVCAADFLREPHPAFTRFILDYADWLSAHLEEWTVTNAGELLPGHPRHYVRINTADPFRPEAYTSPDAGEICVANGGGKHPVRNVVSGEFLDLVRLGVRPALDPIVVESVKVIDAVLKYELPQGPCWRRYNHDGYGQKEDGTGFDGTGVGRCWPLLTGERGHYELAAGRDPLPCLRALEKFANPGRMLPEQVWDAEANAKAHLTPGAPTGSAMPLCWAHAEYLTLVRSARDGKVFDAIPLASERYARGPYDCPAEIWLLAHQCSFIRPGKTLRLILPRPAMAHWSFDHWQNCANSSSVALDDDCHFIDLPATLLPPGAAIVFTFLWAEGWEGRNFSVAVRAA